MSAKCIEKKACTGILADFENLCLTEYTCADLELGYVYTYGDTKKCVSASSCKRRYKFAYEDSRECSSVKPDLENGNFIKSYDTDDVYRCADMVYFQNMAKCVSEDECYYSSIKGIYVNSACLSREEWLAKDARNYVDADLYGETYEEEITSQTDPTDVCYDGTFITDRVCACRSDEYFDDYVGECKSLPSVSNNDNLRIDVEYTING